MELNTLSSRIFGKLKRTKQYFVRNYYRHKVLRELRLEDIPCLLCDNANNFDTLYDHDRYGFAIPVVRCKKCGFVFARPAPTEDFLNMFYGSRMYRGLYRGVLRATQRHLKGSKSVKYSQQNAEFIALDSPRPDLSILDVGSSEGTFLLEIKKRFPRSKVYGVEPGSNFSSFSGKQLDGVYPSTESLPPNLRFDYITLWHVLEHLKNPIETLSALSRRLTLNGQIIVEVPNAEKYTDIHSIHIGHIYHFTPNTMHLLASKAGLDIIRITDEYTSPEAFGMKVILSPHTEEK
jgi:2-polyprenyl-3-methyl-5-hydroxy-6-metoxy-1,4-benzoquinol methylase